MEQHAEREHGLLARLRRISDLARLSLSPLHLCQTAKVNTDVKTKVVAIDFGAPGEKAEQGWSALAQAVEGLDIGVLGECCA